MFLHCLKENNDFINYEWYKFKNKGSKKSRIYNYPARKEMKNTENMGVDAEEGIRRKEWHYK